MRTSRAAATISHAERASISGQYLEHLERLKIYISGVLTDEEF